MDESMQPIATIGVVRTSRKSTETTPIQAAINRDEEGIVQVAPEYLDGLDGLEGFDYAWLLCWLHRGKVSDEGAAPLRQVPFLLRQQGTELGIFATRGPRRINPIGLSLVHLRGIVGDTIRFAGVDLLDGTPVIDIKPYVTAFDRPPGDPRCGWFDGLEIREGTTPEGLGPGPRP